MSKITTPAILESISTRADRSIKLVLGTPELQPEESAKLFSLNRNTCNILVSSLGITDDDLSYIDNISAEQKESFGSKAKTKSQRLRAVLFKNWEVLGSNGEFQRYYDSTMEAIISNFKNKLN